MKRIVTALILIPLVAWVVLWANSWIFFAVLATVSCLCWYEYNEIAGSYGFGWLTMKVPLSREPFLFHGGSNQMNLADVLIQPKYDFAIVAMTNMGGRRADEALKALAGQLYKSFAPTHALE